MSLQQIKEELAQLDRADRRKVMAFLVAKETGEDPDFQRKMAEKIDDRNPANWIELDDVRKRYATLPGA